MKKPIKNFIRCLPVVFLLLLTVTVSIPSAQAALLRAPQMNTPVNTASGVQISWKAVPKAERYRVFVKTAASSWKKLIDTQSTSVVHKVARSGVRYAYTVRCISKDGKRYTGSANPTGKSITYVAPPAIKAFADTASGPKLSWNAVSGARYYAVYIKTSASWRLIATVSTNTFLHTAAKNHTAYTYKIRCLDASKKPVSAFGAARSHTYRYDVLPAPVMNVVNTSDGLQLSWNQVGATAKYRVFLRRGTAWAKLIDVDGNSYLHRDTQPGEQYTYTVRCLSAAGDRYISNYNTNGFSAIRLSPPQLRLENAVYGVRLSWNASPGAEQYRVMINNGEGRQIVASTAALSYLYTPTLSETAYTFSVSAVAGASVSVPSPDQTITYYDPPQITSVTDASDGAQITWEGAAGAAKYRLMIQNGDQWETLADTDALTYTHDANHGATETYTVCSLDADGNVISDHHEGVSHLFRIIAPLSPPVISGFENLESGLKISWNPVPDAQRYRVLVFENNRWVTLGETADTSLTDTTITTGMKKNYTVCCISADGKSYESAYDIVGRESVYIGVPDLRAVNTSNGILLSRNKTDSAACRLFIKQGEDWIALADTAEKEYLYTPALSDTDYTFTACYLDETGAPAGPAGSDGVTVHYTPDLSRPAYSVEMFQKGLEAALDTTIDVPFEAHTVLTRQKAADILCSALGYSSYTVGVNVTDTDSDTMKKMVFLGYFYPDENDRIYPDADINDTEYASLLTEVQRYRKLNGKRALAFGDSIVYGYGNNDWSSCRIMAEKYGMKYTSYAACGATFGICSNDRRHIPDRITAAGEKGCKADVIFLNGGTNDISLIRKGLTPDVFDPAAPKESTFSIGFEYSMMLIRYYWGNVPVIYTRAHQMVITKEELGRQIGDYSLRIARKYNAYAVDVFTNTDLDTENEAMKKRYTMYRTDLGTCDGIHPNLLGYTVYYLPPQAEMLASIPFS